MKKHFFKYRKVFTNLACSPLILISNNSELAAKFLPNDVEQAIEILDINDFNNDLFRGADIKKEKNSFIAEKKEDITEKSVLKIQK